MENIAQPLALSPQPQVNVKKAKLFWPLVLLFGLLTGLGGYEFREISKYFPQASRVIEQKATQQVPMPELKPIENSENNMMSKFESGSAVAPSQARLQPSSPPPLFPIRVNVSTTFKSLDYIMITVSKNGPNGVVQSKIDEYKINKPKAGTDYFYNFGGLDSISIYTINVYACSKKLCPNYADPSQCSGSFSSQVNPGCMTTAPGYADFVVQYPADLETSASNEEAEDLPKPVVSHSNSGFSNSGSMILPTIKSGDKPIIQGQFPQVIVTSAPR